VTPNAEQWQWLAERAESWRQGLDVVAMDGSICRRTTPMLGHLLIQGDLDHRPIQGFQQPARPVQCDTFGARQPDQLPGRGQLFRRRLIRGIS
jgi:hypothetical protein